RRGLAEERGITGLETAIILIAFVVVATVFAFIVLTTGIFSAERGKESVYAGLSKARGTMEVRGGVVLEASGSPMAVTKVSFQVGTAAGGDPIPLDDQATTNRVVMDFRSPTHVDNNLTYTATELAGNGNKLVEPGELFLIEMTAADNPNLADLKVNDRFTIE